MSQVRDLRLLQIRTKLKELRMNELRHVLIAMNLTRSGKKCELVERIAAALEQFDKKAVEYHTSNAITSAFYVGQIDVALKCIEMQTYANVQQHVYPPATSVPQTYTTSIPPARRYPNETLPPSFYTGPLQNPSPSISNVEILQLNSYPSMDHARCFCNPRLGPPLVHRIVSCIACSLKVHTKCHQLDLNAQNIDQSNQYICEFCRSEQLDPFFRLKKTIVKPFFVRFINSSRAFQLEYVLGDSDFANLQFQQNTNCPLELQLRCFDVKDDLRRGHCWPTCTFIIVNGMPTSITQRSPPGHTNPSKVLREIPLNLIAVSRKGLNIIEIRCKENPSIFAFMIQIVQTQTIDSIISLVEKNSSQMTFVEAKEQVEGSFDKSNDGVETTCTLLSLRCPLGLCMINRPARGTNCKHLQCFDLKTFLLYSRKARSKPWMCVICHKFIRLADLRVDPFLSKLLKENGQLEGVEHVEIFPDGTWKVRLTEEENGSCSPSIKKLKIAKLENETDLTKKSKETIAIDLLSSDEENDTESKTGTNMHENEVENQDILVSESELWESLASSATMAQLNTSNATNSFYKSKQWSACRTNENEVAGALSSEDSWPHLFPALSSAPVEPLGIESTKPDENVLPSISTFTDRNDALTEANRCNGTNFLVQNVFSALTSNSHRNALPVANGSHSQSMVCQSNGNSIPQSVICLLDSDSD